MKMDGWKRRVGELTALGEAVLRTEHIVADFHHYVDAASFAEFRSSTLSFLRTVFGESHPYYTFFDRHVTSASPYHVQEGLGALKGVQTDWMAAGFTRLEGWCRPRSSPTSWRWPTICCPRSTRTLPP